MLMLIMLMRAKKMAASQKLFRVLRGVVCNSPSQSEIGTFFSHESIRSLAGTTKRWRGLQKQVLVPDLFGVNAKSQELSELFLGKVLRCESASCHCKSEIIINRHIIIRSSLTENGTEWSQRCTLDWRVPDCKCEKSKSKVVNYGIRIKNCV